MANEIKAMPKKKQAKAKGAIEALPPTDLITKAPVPTIKVKEHTTQEKPKTKRIIFHVSRRVREGGGVGVVVGGEEQSRAVSWGGAFFLHRPRPTFSTQSQRESCWPARRRPWSPP